jgi:hypothetical protein
MLHIYLFMKIMRKRIKHIFYKRKEDREEKGRAKVKKEMII